MYARFMDAIAVSLGKNLESLLTGDTELLYRQAIAAGARNEDWMGKLLKVLSAISKPTINIDAGKLAGDLATQSGYRERMAEVIRNHLLDQNSVFLVMVDDTDQIGSPGDPQHLNRIWGLLLAVRKMTSENPNIKCIVTLRTEVWMRLLRNERGQRDQTDHLRPLVMFLRAPEDHMETIFHRRVTNAAQDCGYNGNFPMELFFDDLWMALPMSEERRTWPKFLVKQSRERPRDLIQLVNHIARAAKSRNALTIGSGDAEKAMEGYSKERTEDLAIEMGYDCPSFLDVVRSFVDMPFECSFEELRAHLLTVPSRFAIQIGGRTLRPSEDDDALLLLSILHESGFINARVSDASRRLGYNHITFLDDPQLAQGSRWNELQATRWEIHPVFRTYLIGLQRDRSRRAGRPLG